MRRLPLAVLLVLAVALSRAGVRAEPDDAYGSLVGMADSAAGDKGPQAGDIPRDNAPADEGRIAAATSSEAPKTDFGSAQAVRPAKKAAMPGAKAAQKEGDAPSVAVPAASAPRVWTKVFSSLIPSLTRVASYEIAASTAAHRVRLEGSRAVTAATAAGSAQGILELVAAATAPYGAEVPLPDVVGGRPTAPSGADETLRDAVAERPAATAAPKR